MKKLIALLLALVMVMAMAACGAKEPAATEPAATEPAATQPAATQPQIEIEIEEEKGYKKNEELAATVTEEITLDLVGAGIFYSEVGWEDLVSGLTKPGDEVIINRWNELYPNVKLNIVRCGWGDTASVVTASALDGSLDIILCGASRTDINEDLTPYLEADPEFRDSLYTAASRRRTENPKEAIPTGITTYTAPVVLWLDTEKFERFGVELPDADWTWEDLLATCEKLTGTDPVTGEDSYGILMPFAGSNNVIHNQIFAAYNRGCEIYQYGETIKDSVINYTSPEAIQSFQDVIDLAKYQSPEATEGVAVNKAMDGNNNWAIMGSNTAVNDYFTLKAAGLEDRYIAVNLPYIDDGEWAGLHMPYFGDENLAIWRGSDQKEWCWEFIKFMMTDEVALQWNVDRLWYTNSKNATEALEGVLPAYLVEVIGHAVDTMPEGYNTAMSENYNQNMFGPMNTTLLTAVDDAINGRKTAEEAAQFVQAAVDEYMAALE